MPHISNEQHGGFQKAEVIEDKNLSSWQASVVCYAEEKFAL